VLAMSAETDSTSLREEPTHRRALFMKKTGLALLAIIFALIVCEAFCRIAGLGFYPSFVDQHFRRYDQLRTAWLYEFRGKNPPIGNPRGAFRIICMGDSCTFGHGIDDDGATYPARLENILRPLVPKVEVINAGIVGTTVRHGYDYLRYRLLAYSPKAIVVQYGWNDHTISDAAEALRRAIAVSSREDLWGKLVRHTRILQVLTKCVLAFRVKSATKGSEEDARKVPLYDYERILTALVKTARGHGVSVVLIALPGAPTTDQGVFQLYGPSDVRLRWHAKYVEATRRVAKQTGAAFVDAVKAFGKHPQRDALIDADGIHPTARGARVLASLVAVALMEKGIVPKRPDAASSQNDR